LDPIKPVEVELVGWDLTRSYRSPGEGEERQDNIFLAQVMAQAGIGVQVAFEAKIRRILTNS